MTGGNTAIQCGGPPHYSVCVSVWGTSFKKQLSSRSFFLTETQIISEDEKHYFDQPLLMIFFYFASLLNKRWNTHCLLYDLRTSNMIHTYCIFNVLEAMILQKNIQGYISMKSQ